ncbi:MAG: GIDE domain-containing protein [bacterium]
MILTLGTISLALSLIFAFAYFRQRRKIAPIRVTMTSSVAHVQELADAFAQFTSASTFRQLVEVKGRVESDAPLIAPLSEQECVYYHVRVHWEYEEIYYEERPEGGRIEHGSDGEEVLFEEEQWQPFWVRDDTARIAVQPAECEVIATATLSRHDEDTGLPDENIRCGRFAIDAPWKTSAEERRPRRFHFEEEAITLGHKIYVLAEATNSSGELRLQKSSQGDRFLISVKPEEALLRSAQFLLWGLLAAAVLCGVIGFILLVRP